MQRKWVVIEKEVGQTPLEAVEQFRAWSPGFKDVKMAYAGRLDPMASGKLLVLLGEECKHQNDYHGLDKEYEVEVLLGAQSDSGDVLGLVSTCSLPDLPRQDIIQTISSFTGAFTPPYPIFSSKPVNGKPLHTWALEDRLNEIEIPLQSGHIHKIRIIKTYTITNTELFEQAITKVNSVAEVTDERKALGQDFRRKPIRKSWDDFMLENSQAEFTVIKIRCTCGSGTYMRSLAEEIGKKLNTCAMALSIHRTVIGAYRHLPFGLSYWRKKY